jgi:hypothetical protein
LTPEIKEIEAAITQLSIDDVAELLAWLEEFHARLWDKQIEDDLEAGRLDSLITEVDAEYEAGMSNLYEASHPVPFLATPQAVAEKHPGVGC